MELNEQTRPQFKHLYKVESDSWRDALTDQDYIANRMKYFHIPYTTLPREKFPNGVFLANNKYKEKDSYLLHFNYIVGKTKQRIMIEKECWVLPEYV